MGEGRDLACSRWAPRPAWVDFQARPRFGEGPGKREKAPRLGTLAARYIRRPRRDEPLHTQLPAHRLASKTKAKAISIDAYCLEQQARRILIRDLVRIFPRPQCHYPKHVLRARGLKARGGKLYERSEAERTSITVLATVSCAYWTNPNPLCCRGSIRQTQEKHKHKHKQTATK